MTDRGTITFAAEDGTEFSLPVNDDGTCGPLPRAGVMKRWNQPALPVGHMHIKFRDSYSAQTFATALSALGFSVSSFRSCAP